MDDIYIKTTLKTDININAKYLKKNIDNIILNILKKNIEGKCITEGYIKENSVQIINRSIGKIVNNNFTSNVLYNIEYVAEICNPVPNDIIKCKIIQINKLGIIAKKGPLSIIVAHQFHKNKKIFKTLDIGDTITVNVLRSKYQINDTEIDVIGQIFTKNDKLIKVKK